MARWSMFLRQRPEVAGPADITRELLESFLSWMASSTWSFNTRSHTLTFTKVFLEWAHRHGTLPGLPVDAVIYEEEVTRPPDTLPQFIPEFVMAQLESPANLARLANPTCPPSRHVLIETGIRGGDASVLAFNPIVNDSVGGACLRFDNSKVAVEQLIPISTKAADTIRAQQDHVRSRWPNGTPWLFPASPTTATAPSPTHMAASRISSATWQRAIGVHDEAGQAVRVHAHQFRHTVGTRLINAGVPQHVIQRLLGHASPRMTARYAQIHDHTIRDAFQHYCAQRVDTAGEYVPYDPDAPPPTPSGPNTTSPVRDSLPNGYLRSAAPTALPAPQRLSHLPRLPDHPRVP